MTVCLRVMKSEVEGRMEANECIAQQVTGPLCGVPC